MATDAELRAALEWETGSTQPADKNLFEWLWEAIQGDFNDERSTGQIAFDAAISIIPVVDQICDVRDVVANCRGIASSEEGEDNTWKWVALVLTLIGLFPSLGSILKGVLKIFFVFVRRYGLDKLVKATDDAMTWVITYLRKREVQKLLRELKVDEVFKWLAEQVRIVKGKISKAALLSAFDKGIGVMKGLLGKVTGLPAIGKRAKATIELVEKVRRAADDQIGKALEPVQRIIDAIIHRLEMESLVQRSGILDARNIHFRGVLPEARAVALMRNAEPLPPWLSKGRAGKWAATKPSNHRGKVDKLAGKHLTPDEFEKAKARGELWPDIPDKKIETFHAMAATEIKGPAKLYRVISPGNQAAGDFWMTEEVWNKIQNAPDPKVAWRKYCAVWPDWNANGQFAVLEVPPGENLKVWQGPAASQSRDVKDKLDVHLEGGWDQVWVQVEKGKLDTTRYYMRGGSHGETLHPPGLSRSEWEALSKSKQPAYTPIRERINHPNVKGPLDTGWGPTDFDAQLRDARIGLPALPGQVTN